MTYLLVNSSITDRGDHYTTAEANKCRKIEWISSRKRPFLFSTLININLVKVWRIVDKLVCSSGTNYNDYWSYLMCLNPSTYIFVQRSYDIIKYQIMGYLKSNGNLLCSIPPSQSVEQIWEVLWVRLTFQIISSDTGSTLGNSQGPKWTCRGQFQESAVCCWVEWRMRRRCDSHRCYPKSQTNEWRAGVHYSCRGNSQRQPTGRERF